MSQTVGLLLDAAETHIRRKGYNGVSFRDLADELGIKSASVHYHFRQKEDLVEALVQRYSDQFFLSLTGRVDETDLPAQKVTAFVATYRSALKDAESICLCGMLGAEISGLPMSVNAAVSAFLQANIDWLVDALPKTWRKEVRLNKGCQIVSTLQGAMMLSNSLGDPKLFDRACKTLAADIGLA